MILRLCGLALLTAAAALLIKQYKPELALPVSAAGAVIMLLALMDELGALTDGIGALSSGFAEYTQPVVKSLGIALIAQTSGELCRDIGENACASRVELAGKLCILSLCLPLITELLELVKTLLPG